MVNRLLGICIAFIIPVACVPQVRKYVQSEDVLSWEPDIHVFDSLNMVEPSGEQTQVMQRGYGGAKLTDFNYYAGRIIKPHPFKAIVVFVANDITGGENDRTPREVYQLFRMLVEQIRERNGQSPVFWIETTPTPSRWDAIEDVRKANRLIRDYCNKQEGLYYISTADLFLDETLFPDSSLFREDMLHLNRSGYLRWAERIKGSLEAGGIEP
jgi:lysophospholipase L1-like esterase